MTRIAVIGCGVIGATIAYELSCLREAEVIVIDQQPDPTTYDPALPQRPNASHAALGILVGVSSQKRKGRAWLLRKQSLQRYRTLLPELEALTGRPLQGNPHGLVHLCFDEVSLDRWKALAIDRAQEGFILECLTAQDIQRCYPFLHHPTLVGAVYSPQDRQICPTSLIQALVTGAIAQGAQCHFATTVQALTQSTTPGTRDAAKGTEILTDQGTITADWVIVAAGLGTPALTAHLQPALQPPIRLEPVLGQALHLRLPPSLEALNVAPVITGHDIHLLPLGNTDCWIGATVEFTTMADPTQLHHLLEQAIAFCPLLAEASIIGSWSGLRPRPVDQPAPVIRSFPNDRGIVLATGHYRNGVLLAPATAQAVREMIFHHVNPESSP